MTYYYPAGTTGPIRTTTPVHYSYPKYMYTTSGYSTPNQTYYTVPQQEPFYQPVRQRRGLLGIFQPRWRQQATPAYYTTTSYPTAGYTNTGYMTPGYTNASTMSPAYTTRAYAPTTTYYYYTVPPGYAPASMTPPMASSGTAAPATTTPVYSETMYTAPNATTPAGATPATTGTAPAGATPATGTIPSVVKPPAPPAVRLPGNTSQ